MHLHSRVFCGTGPKVEEDDNTSFLEPTDPYDRYFGMQSFIPTKKGSHPGSPAPTSPTSSDSSFSHEGSIHSEPDPPRRGDPAWIARPRNPFIIFRCEYSREHSRGDGKRVRRPPGSQPVEKTLSKRAAEAWHQLSPEGKNRFKVLADREKEEHARLYPNYRFKPTKRGTVSGAASGAAAKKRPPPPTLLMPKSQFLRPDGPVLAPNPRYPPQQTVSDPLFSFPSIILPGDTATTKAGRRRSASDPSARFGQHPYIPGVWSPHSPRLVMKRSRSDMGSRLPLHFPDMGPPSPYGEPSFNPRIFEVSIVTLVSKSLSLISVCISEESTSSSGYYTPEESFAGLAPDFLPSQTYSWVDPTTSGMGPHATANPSSLSGWNGENSNPPMVSAVPSSTAWDPMASLAFGEELLLPLADYSYSTPSGAIDERELSAALAHYIDNGPWVSEPFTYDDGSGASHIPPEFSYPSLGLCGSGHAIAENNEEDHFETLDTNGYFYQ